MNALFSAHFVHGVSRIQQQAYRTVGTIRGVTRVTRRAQFPWRRITAAAGGGHEKSQQRHKYFLQYSTFAPERPQVRTWGRQTCFCPGRHLTSLRPWEQHPLLFTTNCTNRAFFFWRLHLTWPSHPGHSTTLLTCLALQMYKFNQWIWS